MVRGIGRRRDGGRDFMVSTTGLWPTLLATWLSITPVPVSTPEPGADNAGAPREVSLPAKRD